MKDRMHSSWHSAAVKVETRIGALLLEIYAFEAWARYNLHGYQYITQDHSYSLQQPI